MSHKPNTNKFLKSASTSSSSSSSFLSPDTRDTRDRTNSFLGRAVLEVEVAKDKDIKDVKDVKDIKVEEEFPVLGGTRPAATTTTEKKGLASTPAPKSEAEAGGLRGPCPLLYKTALLTKINHSHIEEQARIQKALRREMEAKEDRLRQMELSSMRERFVADAVHGCGSMAYDDDHDPGQKYNRRDDDDDD
jgi:hypothetical protein